MDINLTGNVSASPPRAVFRLPEYLLDEYDVRPDGQQFLILDFQGNQADAPITVVLNWWVELEK